MTTEAGASTTAPHAEKPAAKEKPMTIEKQLAVKEKQLEKKLVKTEKTLETKLKKVAKKATRKVKKMSAAKKIEKPNGAVGARPWKIWHTVGSGTKAFKYKPLPWAPGACKVLKCKQKATSKMAKVCRVHKKEIRKQQLKANNVTYRKRIKDHKVISHIVYTDPDTGKPMLTQWAQRNPDKAMAIVKKGRGTIDLDTFRQLKKKADEDEAKREAAKSKKVASKVANRMAKRKAKA